MDINVLTIGTLLILLTCMIRGLYMGMIKTVFSTFGFIIAIALATSVSGPVSEALDRSPVYNIVNEQVHEVLFEKSSDTADLTVEDEEQDDPSPSSSPSSEDEIIDSLPLPSFIKNTLKADSDQELYDALGINAFQDYISAFITGLILKALSYLVVFLIVTIFLKIVVTVLDLIAKLPVLRTFNRAGGLIFGIVNGFVIIWIICIVLAMLSGTQIAQTAYSLINQSLFLKIIYNTNPLLRIAW